MAEKRSSSGRELWPPPAWAIPQACDTMQEVAVEEDKVLGAVRQVPEAVGDEETATCPTRWAPLALGEHAHSRAEDAGGNGARHVMVWGPAMEEPSFVNIQHRGQEHILAVVHPLWITWQTAPISDLSEAVVDGLELVGAGQWQHLAVGAVHRTADRSPQAQQDPRLAVGVVHRTADRSPQAQQFRCIRWKVCVGGGGAAWTYMLGVTYWREKSLDSPCSGRTGFQWT